MYRINSIWFLKIKILLLLEHLKSASKTCVVHRALKMSLQIHVFIKYGLAITAPYC